MRRVVLLAAMSLLVLGTSGCGHGGRVSAHPARLVDLRGVGQLRSLFNSRSGEPRLIVLVSPT
jgi:hypothetical protein